MQETATGTTEQKAACCNAAPPQNRTRLWLLAGVGVLGAAAAIYGGWEWLLASGAGVTLLALAPCLAMCALGLCMGRGKK